ncbi:hypothetical protein T02_4239 [Trichinella nativa]|uniref:Uncharacterized protein n=1 Tax=Trichinella nativa TaxID=6335 RepID=A0A0V1L1C9_9BILA|nr:hypothetical protein T02_4239 [Trichinella nativa]
MEYDYSPGPISTTNSNSSNSSSSTRRLVLQSRAKQRRRRACYAGENGDGKKSVRPPGKTPSKSSKVIHDAGYSKLDQTIVTFQPAQTTTRLPHSAPASVASIWHKAVKKNCLQTLHQNNK